MRGLSYRPKNPRPLDRPLPLIGEVEIIESGWWDGHDARRKYFSCLLPNGALGWAYEDRDSGQQYLQGLWG